MIALLLLFVDFSTKAAASHLLPSILYTKGPIVLFDRLLGIKGSISLAYNKGAAWGLFANYQIPLLIVRMATICWLVGYLFFKESRRMHQWALMLISVGAIGNVLDFFIYGYVIDFIDLNLWGYDFPLFNVADALITVGICLLFILSIVSKSHHECCKMD